MDAWLVAYQNRLDELEASGKAASKNSQLSSSAKEDLLSSRDPCIAAKEGEHKPSDAEAVISLEEPKTEQNAQDGRLWLHGDLHLTPGNRISQGQAGCLVPCRPSVTTPVLLVHHCRCLVQHKTEWANPRSSIQWFHELHCSTWKAT